MDEALSPREQRRSDDLIDLTTPPQGLFAKKLPPLGGKSLGHADTLGSARLSRETGLGERAPRALDSGGRSAGNELFGGFSLFDTSEPKLRGERPQLKGSEVEITHLIKGHPLSGQGSTQPQNPTTDTVRERKQESSTLLKGESCHYSCMCSSIECSN